MEEGGRKEVRVSERDISMKTRSEIYYFSGSEMKKEAKTKQYL